jgi:thiol-disulfide isomerase/thioredoxin
VRSGRMVLIGVLMSVTACAGAHADELPIPAPSFTVRTFDGKTVRLTSLRGKPVLVDFWATWCRPCRAAMPHLEEIQKRYRSQGLVVIGLSVDALAPADVRRFAQNLGVSFQLAMANDRVLDKYGPIRFLPTTFFINREGAIVRRVRGYIDAETLDGYVLELLPDSLQRSKP